MCTCLCQCMHAELYMCLSPSSAVLTEPVTFSPGPAPVTARTDMSYIVLIFNPVKRRVVEFCSANIWPVMFFNPESLSLAKMTCNGTGMNTHQLLPCSTQNNNLFIKDQVQQVDLVQHYRLSMDGPHIDGTVLWRRPVWSMRQWCFWKRLLPDSNCVELMRLCGLGNGGEGEDGERAKGRK